MSVEDQSEPLFDSGGHPTATTLAGLDLDCFDVVTTRRIQSHLSSCTRCQAAVAGLHRATESLSRAPYPQMPDAVFERIQATIRSEQRQRSQAVRDIQAPRNTPGPNGAPVVDLATERARRRRRGQWMGAAAAGVAVIAAVGISIGVASSGDSGGSGKYAGGPPASVVPSDQLPGGGQGQPAPGGAAYTRQNLSANVPDIVHHAGLSVPGLKVDPAGAMKNPQKRAACVAALGEQRTLVAVQRADFEGRSSFVFVFAREGKQAPNVYVVGPACGNGTADQRFATHGSY